jgi:ApaG protein
MPPFRELRSLCVRLDKLVYAPDLEAPPDRPYPFVYFLTIENLSGEAVTIKGRKWVITDAEGGKTVVEASGVVGKFPRIEPGEHFSYNSYHVINSDSMAEGAFIGLNDEGEAVLTRIPPFEMKVPL